jgi:DNA invertase Pin-like site-specific DNA recombinase
VQNGVVTNAEDGAVKSKRVAIYARVSTDQQTSDNQVLQLREMADRHGWVIVYEYIDHGVSGSKGRERRPQFDAMLKAAMQRKFDLVAAWSIDRLGRSLNTLVLALDDLHKKGVDLYLHQQQLDTTTSMGMAMFQMCGVFAQLERAMIQERVKAGLSRARAQGKRLGRPSVAPSVVSKVKARRRKGQGILSIAKALGIGTGTVQRIVGESR